MDGVGTALDAQPPVFGLGVFFGDRYLPQATTNDSPARALTWFPEVMVFQGRVESAVNALQA
jgi:hypothetical protein